MADLVKNGKNLYFIAKSLLEKEPKHYEIEFYTIFMKNAEFLVLQLVSLLSNGNNKAEKCYFHTVWNAIDFNSVLYIF